MHCGFRYFHKLGCPNDTTQPAQRADQAADRAYVTLLESTASELLLALSDRGIDLPEMEALARVMEER